MTSVPDPALTGPSTTEPTPPVTAAGADSTARTVCPNCQETEGTREKREQCGRCDPDGINSRARFDPPLEPFTQPCLTVASDCLRRRVLAAARPEEPAP